ncbi:hypothetical protein KL923_005132 [Ogataea haglerorum]|uniref:Uncharacterized protein n=1 Tax=Ogataea haglerorum TaxID=1937702 RepID=A0ABQ7RA46_9ASCO|nr:hypothetical protein KL923_005132 [Ogataea haglerorum]KAG7754251.1 hypothetical protein KL947_005061 [Ogataea haglerorum]KAG7762081.1 hypothetical protein KL946_004945 [Ogataea haglerorum]
MATPISANLLLSLKPAKLFSNHVPNTPITSIDFDHTGQFLLTAGVDESIHLYDVAKGRHVKPIYSKKYGCHLAKLTSKENTCVFASTKENDTIRYLSLHDNSFIRYFKGHTALVTDLAMADLNHMFVSAACDHSVRLWDTRSANCQATLVTDDIPFSIALDPSNTVVAIYNSSSNVLSLHAVAHITERPFATVVCDFAKPPIASHRERIPRHRQLGGLSGLPVHLWWQWRRFCTGMGLETFVDSRTAGSIASSQKDRK